MGRTELTLKVLGLVTTVTFSVISLVMESRRKTKLTNEDKDDIAERVVTKIKSAKLLKAPTKVVES